MHEHGLCDPLVTAVVDAADGRPVRAVTVRVGVRHRIDDAAFTAAFQHAAEGTCAAEAAVDIVDVPARGICSDCGAETPTSDILDPSAQCGVFGLRLVGGDDLAVAAVQYG